MGCYREEFRDEAKIVYGLVGSIGVVVRVFKDSLHIQPDSSSLRSSETSRFRSEVSRLVPEVAGVQSLMGKWVINMTCQHLVA